jgi:hypothetical protein
MTVPDKYLFSPFMGGSTRAARDGGHGDICDIRRVTPHRPPTASPATSPPQAGRRKAAAYR